MSLQEEKKPQNPNKNFLIHIGQTWSIPECSYLSLKTLNQVTNGHAGRDGMGVDNYIRCDAFTGEGHILEQGNSQSVLLRTPALRKGITWIQIKFFKAFQRH